jgi:hypothetical protein
MVATWVTRCGIKGCTQPAVLGSSQPYSISSSSNRIIIIQTCTICAQGLGAVAALLRASASKWWRGCKLSTLEIYADGRQFPAQPPASKHDAATASPSIVPAKAATTDVAGTAAVAAKQQMQQQPGLGQSPAAAAAATSKPTTPSKCRSDGIQTSGACGSIDTATEQQKQQELQRPQQVAQAMTHLPAGESSWQCWQFCN